MPPAELEDEDEAAEVAGGVFPLNRDSDSGAGRWVSPKFNSSAIFISSSALR